MVAEGRGIRSATFGPWLNRSRTSFGEKFNFVLILPTSEAIFTGLNSSDVISIHCDIITTLLCTKYCPLSSRTSEGPCRLCIWPYIINALIIIILYNYAMYIKRSIYLRWEWVKFFIMIRGKLIRFYFV